MKRNHIAIVLFLGVVAVLVVIWFRQNRQSASNRITVNTFSPTVPQQATPSPAATVRQTPEVALPSELAATLPERDKRNIGKILQAFKAPITFYGRVIDEEKQPVAGAKVHYSAADQYFGDSSKYESISDESGFFSITGINGAGLYVNVAKDGYYGTNESGAGFGYGVPSGRQPPSKESPAIFVLRKKGIADSLIHVSSRQINVLDNGRSLNIDLSTGLAGRGNLQLESWIGDSSQRRFDWRYRLSVPGGGLVERKEEFVFEAPIDDYQPVVEVNMPANAERWSSDVNKSYFAKLPDGKYARFSINLYPGKRNFVVLESYVNPAPGNRNLEFAPTEENMVR